MKNTTIINIIHNVAAVSLAAAITMFIMVNGMYIYMPEEFNLYLAWLIPLLGMSFTAGVIVYISIMGFFEKLEKKGH